MAALLEVIGVPAFVEGRFFDVLAANDLARALSPNMAVGRNRVRSVFLDPAERALYPQWEGATALLVAGLRESIGARGTDPRAATLVGEMSLASERFARLWARHDVAVRQGASTRMLHPQVGEMLLDREKLAVGDGLVLAAAHPGVRVRTIAADLSTHAGIETVAAACEQEEVTMLVNNAGVAHYMPLAELSAEQARELVMVKTVAPTMLTRAVVGGMVERGAGTIITVAGMIAFSGPAPHEVVPRRAVYAGGLSFALTMSQTLAAELEGTGVGVQVLCPGVVATEFHTRQGMDLSAVPRMSADEVVTASLRGIELGEVVVAPGVEDASLLDSVFTADLAAFAGQGPHLASRYQQG